MPKTFGKPGYELRRWYLDMVVAAKEGECDEMLRRMQAKFPENQYKYVSRVNEIVQFLSFAQRRRDTYGIVMLGYHSSSVAEAMNNAAIPARKCQFFESLVSVVQGEKRRFENHRSEATRAFEQRAKLTPEANNIIDKLDQNRRKYAATATLTETHTDNPRVQLTSDEPKEIVNLTKMTCTCGVPITFSQPCTHVYLAAKTAGFPPKDMFTHRFFDVDTWKRQYPSNVDFASVSISEVYQRNQLVDDNLILPPVTPRLPGRPAAGRHQGVLERSQPRKCSRCKRRGHNKRNRDCPMNRTMQE